MKHIAPITQTPEWLVAAVDQFETKFLDYGGEIFKLTPYSVILMTLTEPDEGASPEDIQLWERTCDKCGIHCPRPHPLYTGVVERTVRGSINLNITFGVCHRCVTGFKVQELLVL